ncbi:MAG: hypothetical protein ACXADB_07855 [Candidatus Hermodarchaeia archaeon]|jgi:hypothetical protein
MKTVEPEISSFIQDTANKAESKLVDEVVFNVIFVLVDTHVWNATRHVNDIRKYYGER